MPFKDQRDSVAQSQWTSFLVPGTCIFPRKGNCVQAGVILFPWCHLDLDSFNFPLQKIELADLFVFFFFKQYVVIECKTKQLAVSEVFVP